MRVAMRRKKIMMRMRMKIRVRTRMRIGIRTRARMRMKTRVIERMRGMRKRRMMLLSDSRPLGRLSAASSNFLAFALDTLRRIHSS